MDDVEQVETEQTQTPEIKVSDYARKFKASEKRMKADFLPKYQLARQRLRSEHLVTGRGTKKLTHEQANLVYSIGVNFVNSVYFKSPNCNLTAREQVDTVQVENTEIKVNDWLKDKKVKKVVKRAIWDAYTGGFGAVVTDYEYDDVENPNEVLEPGTDGSVDPTTGQMLPGTPPKFGRLVLKNKITIQRIRPDLMRFPDGFDFDNPGESPWIGFDIIHPIDEVKQNAKWDQEISQTLEGKKYKSLSSTDEKSSADEGEDLYVKISYAFIKQDDDSYKLLIFSGEKTEKPLYFDVFDKGHTGCPIKFIVFNPLDDDCPYPCGDAWIFESQLNAVDQWWKSIVRHVKRSNPKTAYDMGAVDQAEVGKLKSNDDNLYVGLKNKEKRDLRTLFAELKAPEAHTDLDKLWNVARELLNEISPKTSMSRGTPDKKVDTATEAKIMSAGEMIDTDARIDDVKDFITDIVLDVAGMLTQIAAPMSIGKEVEEIPGLEVQPKRAEMVFDEVGAEGFTNKVTIDVDVESMQSQNKDVLRRQLIEALGLFKDFQVFFDAIGKMPDPQFWIEKLMETMYIRNIDKGFIDKPPMPVDPMTGQPMPMQPMGPGGMPKEMPTGEMPMEAVEAGMAQRV